MNCCRFSPDGSKYATAGADGKVNDFDLIQIFKNPCQIRNIQNCVRFCGASFYFMNTVKVEYFLRLTQFSN